MGHYLAYIGMYSMVLELILDLITEIGANVEYFLNWDLFSGNHRILRINIARHCLNYTISNAR
jgi:hypothetical protein